MSELIAGIQVSLPTMARFSERRESRNRIVNFEIQRILNPNGRKCAQQRPGQRSLHSGNESLQRSFTGGENVRVGEAVRQDRVDNEDPGDPEDQVPVVRARNVHGRHSIHREASPLSHADHVCFNGERADGRCDLHAVDILQHPPAHRRALLSFSVEHVGRDDSVYKPTGGTSLYIYFFSFCTYII